MRPTVRTLAHRLAAHAAAGPARRWLPACGGAGHTGSDVIYTCIDAKGKRHTSDSPDRRLHGPRAARADRDGSLVRVIAPTLTATERAEAEAREQRLPPRVGADRIGAARPQPDAALSQRGRARQGARGRARTVRGSAANLRERLKELTAERKPLLDEAEFYVGKPLPPS